MKELSRPTHRDMQALKRLGRYLCIRTRMKTLFEYQDQVRDFSTYVDTDLAGCRLTRKSTTGGLVMFGKHMI